MGALIGHQGNFVGLFVSYKLLFVAHYFDLCRLEYLGIQFLFVSTWIRIWSKVASCSNHSWTLKILVENLPMSWRGVQMQSYFWSAFFCIRTEYREVRTRNNSIFGHFSRSEISETFSFYLLYMDWYILIPNFSWRYLHRQ